MVQNFREFHPGNSSGNEENNNQNKAAKGGGGNSIGRLAGMIAALLVLAIVAFESVYSIGEQEQGVVTTFGSAGSVVTSGLHFKIPFVQRVTKVNTTILGFPIGYRSSNDENASQEQIDDESLMITSDPVKYLYHSQQPQQILKNIAQSCIRNIISNYAVDDVITTGKSKIQAEIKEMIIEKLEEQDIGLMLVNISMQDAEPPTEAVIEAFKAVETAKQGKETAINNANKYRNEKIPEASAKADRITQDAEAAKQERVNEGIAQAARFNEMFAEYEKNPLLTKQRMFYEAMEEVLPGVKLIIDDGSGNLNKTLYLDELQLEDITDNHAEASSDGTAEEED